MHFHFTVDFELSFGINNSQDIPHASFSYFHAIEKEIIPYPSISIGRSAEKGTATTFHSYGKSF